MDASIPWKDVEARMCALNMVRLFPLFSLGFWFAPPFKFCK